MGATLGSPFDREHIPFSRNTFPFLRETPGGAPGSLADDGLVVGLTSDGQLA